jgi:transcriptional regulator of acetoin/glycerol metabolism
MESLTSETSHVEPVEAPALVSYHAHKQRMLATSERGYFEGLLRKYQGNVSESARSAGLDRKSFWRKMKQHDLNAAAFRKQA